MRKNSPDGKGVRGDKDGAEKVHLAEQPGDMVGQRAEWMRQEAERHVGSLALCAEVLGLDPKDTEERRLEQEGRGQICSGKVTLGEDTSPGRRSEVRRLVQRDRAA